MNWQGNILKVVISLFFVFLFCKQSIANDLWNIDKDISSIEFEVPVLFATNVIGKFNIFDGYVSLDLSNQNNNKALINVTIDSLEINYKRYRDLVLSEVFFDSKKFPLGLIDTNNFKFNYEDDKINLIGELTIKGKSQNIPIDIEIIKLASELVQIKSEISFSRNDFEIGAGSWKNTTILKDEINIRANIFLFKE
tara:strand:- start:259 stop:843 length:585 start_codon:yes stop_codon:yes gene_type:complete